MATVLQQLAKITDVVADTGDIAAIKKHQPVDATTNPSLLLKAFSLSDYQTLVAECKVIAKTQTMAAACDYFAVKIGVEILASIPGKISTEVDARLSFDTPASINRARQLIALYQSFGIDKNRVLIKLAATWEGICAAQVLEREGINCNLTLLFSFAQAQACAEAGVFLISPFVGRILDWHKAQNPESSYNSSDDPGVLSVKRIYQYYKQHDYSTVVMGASFRNIGQVMALAGCDKLTVAPNLLDELKQLNEPLMQQLSPEQKQSDDDKQVLTQAEFRMAHNDDAMATEKLAQGIRAFIVDQEKLEFQLSQG